MAYRGDDIVAEGGGCELWSFHAELKKYFDAEVKYLMGPDAGDDKFGTILNRCLTWREDGLLWEPGPRHAELVIAELGLVGAKSTAAPGLRISAEEHEHALVLEGPAAKQYRATAARCGFLSMDRWEILYPTKECLRGMSNPTTAHLRMLKRIGRFLIGLPRVGVLYTYQPNVIFLDAIGDSDHNQCPITRKSTNGGAVKLGRVAITACSTTQSYHSFVFRW